MDERGTCGPLETAATTKAETSGIVVPMGMYFAMPQAVPANIKVGADGKAITLTDREWRYTYTLRIVK